MQSIELIRDNLIRSRDRVLANVEDMREHAVVFPTPHGGSHTLWVLGHLAVIEGMVVQSFMFGEENPLAEWEEIFDGTGTTADLDHYPPFDEALQKCREMREATLAVLDLFVEDDLDNECAVVPPGYESFFGTYRLCLQYLADHWYMHRGNLADARRASGVDRMWV